MDSAISMAKKYKNRFKIVTLDGQVINAGGSMTGGSRKQDTVNIIGREREIETLKNSIEELKTEIDAKTIRPLRAIQSGQGTQDDTDKLAELETQAEAIRAQIRSFGGGL